MKKRMKTRRKAVKRRKKSFFTSFLFSAVTFSSILILSGIGFLLFSPRFQISNITIAGNNDISTDDLKKAAEEKMKTSFSMMGMDFSTESIFLSVAKGANSLAEAFPQIDKITVKKNFPNGLSIQIVEKTPFAGWCEAFDAEKCYLVDKFGSYIKDVDAGAIDSGLVRVNEKEKIDSPAKKDILSSLMQIGSGLDQNQIKIANFDLYKDKVIVGTNLKCQLIFTRGEDLNWQIEKLKIVLKNDTYSKKLNSLQYIDLRFGNQAIIK